MHRVMFLSCRREQLSIWHAALGAASGLTTVSCLLLQLRVADCETELNEALKLYRDMNHLSLAGGITCEQVPAVLHCGAREVCRLLVSRFCQL